VSARDDLPRLRAKFVMAQIGAWRERGFRKEAVTRIKSLPVQIRAQGFTVALAVLLREGGASAASAELARILAEWLLGAAPVRTVRAKDGQKGGVALLRAAVDADRPSYLAVQREALGFLDELKLLSDALYGGLR
jgi:hypothetical protein